MPYNIDNCNDMNQFQAVDTSVQPSYSQNLSLPLPTMLEFSQPIHSQPVPKSMQNMNLNMNVNPMVEQKETTFIDQSNLEQNSNMANKKVCMDYMTEALKKDMHQFMKIKKDVENNLRIWYYIDNMEKLQGPFRTDEIFTWRKTNELNGSVYFS